MKSRGFKELCLELVPRNAAWVRSLVVEEFSVNIWDRCQPKIIRNLRRNWFVAVLKQPTAGGINMLLIRRSYTGYLIFHLGLRTIGSEAMIRLAGSDTQWAVEPTD